MSHDHTAGRTTGTAGMRHRKRLIGALSITGSVMIIEVIAGYLSGSLALLADAGHMLSDTSGLIIALVATWLAARPATATWTFGWQRAEVLAALINGVILTVVATTVMIEGIQRLGEPAEVQSPMMLVVGVVGLIANFISLRLLTGGKDESINVRGAYLEVLGDLLGSLAVIVAAVVISTTGWEQADAVASMLIAVMIAPRAFSLLRDVARVLLEGAPKDVAVDQVREHMMEVDQVEAVHDLHAWTITSGVPVLTAHVVVSDDVAGPAGYCEVLDKLQECLEGHFDVEHSTIQIEPASHTRDHPEHSSHA